MVHADSDAPSGSSSTAIAADVPDYILDQKPDQIITLYARYVKTSQNEIVYNSLQATAETKTIIVDGETYVKVEDNS